MICANILFYLNIQTYHLRKGTGQCRIASYMEAVVMWMLCAFLFLEGLSLFHGINQISLCICWGLLNLVLLVCLFRQRGKQQGLLISQYFPIKEIGKNKFNWVLVLIGIWVVMLALMTVPYNWDSMTYRLPRIAYWAQNGSVEHFATNCTRALANPPLGEFVQLHVYLLTGECDIFFNLLQAFSYLTCAALVYAIAKRLQCNNVFCSLAALLFMAMPIAFSEALNTQVDLFAGIWLLTFVYLILDFVESREKIAWSKGNVFKVCVMGLCVAWGYMSKPNVCVAMLLFALWLLVNCLVRKDRFGVLFPLALCALGSMLVPIGWEIARNLQTYGAISAPIAGARQLVGTLAPSYLLVNFLKNFSFNLPTVFWKRGMDYMLSFMWQFSGLINVPLNAEEISEDGRQFAYMSAPNYAHDTAINPLILWLLIICIAWTLIRFRKIDWKRLYQSYPIVAVISFLLFCTVLRWEPFVTRYMVSFLALLCPATVLILQKQLCKEGRNKSSKMTGPGYAVAGILVVFCLVELVNMSQYHWKMRTDFGAGDRPYGYFANRATEYEPVVDIVQYIKDNGYQEVGLFHGEDDYEYPYWMLLGDNITRMEHVGVTNESAVYADTEYRPQCIIWYGEVPAETFVWNGQSYPNVLEIAENRYILTYS